MDKALLQKVIKSGLVAAFVLAGLVLVLKVVLYVTDISQPLVLSHLLAWGVLVAMISGAHFWLLQDKFYLKGLAARLVLGVLQVEYALSVLLALVVAFDWWVAYKGITLLLALQGLHGAMFALNSFLNSEGVSRHKTLSEAEIVEGKRANRLHSVQSTSADDV